MKAVSLLLNKKALWIGMTLLFFTPVIWLGWTQPWQYQPQVPTGPLPEQIAERPAHPLPPGIQAAKDEGMRLWGVHEWEKMQPYLEQAANHGDPEAMYFLGEAHRRLYGFSKSAMAWYMKAANAGDVYAMLRLNQAGVCQDGEDSLFIEYCADDYERWHVKAFQLRLPDAEAGDTEAMLDVFTAGGSIQWLRRAAEADNAEAQLEIGIYIAGGRYPGWPYYRYWSDEARLRAALPWYRRAAELGYPPAMARLARTLHRFGEDEQFWMWTQKAAAYGVIESNLRVAICYLNPDWTPNLRCPVAQDVAKGLGGLKAIRGQAGERFTRSQYNLQRDIINAMTDEELEQAERYAQEWLEQLQAPFSEYPPRWGM